jgi:hypothetical protein
LPPGSARFPDSLAREEWKNGRVLFRHNPAFNGQPPEWSESFALQAPHVWWSFIEEEVTGEPNRYLEGPTIAAVQCLGADRWKALRAEREVEAPRP